MSRKRNAHAETAKPRRGERSLQASLFDGEEVKVVARPGRLASFPRYLMTLGLYGFWRKRDTSAITDQRVLLGKGIVRRDERSIALSNVEDVTVSRRGLYSYVNLTIGQRGRATVQRVGPLGPSAARRFAREILRQR